MEQEFEILLAKLIEKQKMEKQTAETTQTTEEPKEQTPEEIQKEKEFYVALSKKYHDSYYGDYFAPTQLPTAREKELYHILRNSKYEGKVFWIGRREEFEEELGETYNAWRNKEELIKKNNQKQRNENQRLKNELKNMLKNT